MGKIIIEIPQNVNRTYRIVSEDSAKKLLTNLERLIEKEISVEDEDILGVWAMPPKSTKKRRID
ncbi:MAG TPA: hypothetical protein PKE69_07100 [Pyrinomonadaceae bacterium]|nr:hypothetical protein [Pyrinomonadaceae bacterium]